MSINKPKSIFAVVGITSLGRIVQQPMRKQF